ncbi:MAG TPA: L,D-transpeptidase family protein [Gemmatimonadaceae bacterium]|nr:L,D-transpeptidase family protein [Gemmatimonadaceae bacterium]
MLLPLLGAVALMTSPVSVPDTAAAIKPVATPTISRTPVVGIKGVLQADSIVVEKQKHTLTLFQSGVVVRSYQVALGKQPTGDKLKIGDGRTPEGVYRIDFRNPDSKYHMSLHISYPDLAHQERAKALGVPAGGDVMIHGLPPAYAKLGAAHRTYDWTEGCIAVTNAEIEEIWRAVPNGAPIQIKP